MMYCPKCATDNLEGASFCRTCGTNVAFIPQAISGQLAREGDTTPGQPNALDFRKGKRGKKPSKADGVGTVIGGMGFLFAAIAIALFGHQIAGQVWWFWMLIPAFITIGKGVSEIIAAKQLPPEQYIPNQGFMPPRERPQWLPQQNTGEMISQAPSVTEGTTRHLGGEASRQFVAGQNLKP